MKRVMIALSLMGLVWATLTGNAQAEIVSVSYGLPITYNIANFDGEGDWETDGGTSGYLLHVKLPFGLGIGMENYSRHVKAKYAVNPPAGSESCYWGNTGNPCRFKVKNTMYDVFYLLPVPVLNITVGAGLGTSEIGGDWSGDGRSTENAGLTQLYAQVGYPILAIIDVHVSYHQITAVSKGKIKYGDSLGGQTDDFDPSGSVLAVGAQFTF